MQDGDNLSVQNCSHKAFHLRQFNVRAAVGISFKLTVHKIDTYFLNASFGTRFVQIGSAVKARKLSKDIGFKTPLL